jgi:alpha-tubulin suppressor-like RCC1 family protein
VYTSPVASPPLPRSGDAPLTVVAGHKLTLVLTDSGRCYSWGNNVGNVLAHEKKFGEGAQARRDCCQDF